MIKEGEKVIGWFEIKSGQGIMAKIDILQLEEIETGTEKTILVTHQVSLTCKERERKDISVSGDFWQLENGKLRLFKKGKLIFWTKENEKVSKVNLFSSVEEFKKARQCLKNIIG